MTRVDHYGRGQFRFEVRDGGPPDGPPVVLLHGFPQDSGCWDRVFPLLHEAGLRTLAPDQRGYSPSARPPSRRDYRSGELVDDVLALLDALEVTSAHIVGHDWGGGVAWLLAGTHPDRVRSLTVLSTPHPRAMAQAWLRGGQALRSWYMLAFQLPVLPEYLLAASLPRMLSRSGLPAPLIPQVRSRLDSFEARRAAINWYRGMPLSPRVPARRVRVPSTYVYGRRDPFLGPVAARATADFVQADYRFAELDAGHWLPETCPAEVAHLIRHRVANS